MIMQRSSHRSGFSFLEVMAAAGLVAIFLAGAFTANARGLSMIRCAKETNGASKILQQRMEQLRSASWTEVTDAATVQGIYATAPDAWESCNQMAESLTIAPWPAVAGASTIQITRSSAGTATIVTDNEDLVDGPAVLVTTRVSWTGVGNRNRTRETCTVIANGGLGR
jgi:Tfp pilus assembly protein PilV